MTDTTSIITLLIYPVSDHLGTGENWNAVFSDGDVISDEIGVGVTPHEAVSNLLHLVSNDMDQIISEITGGVLE